MTKARQISLAFNNDGDVKRIRDGFKGATLGDLKMFLTAAEFEYTQRTKTQFRDRTKEAIAGFLDNISFDYFCTFTTRKPVSMFATRRIADKVCERVGAGYNSSVFWASEEFDVRDGFHFHALLKMSEPETLVRLHSESKYYEKVEPLNVPRWSKMDLFDWYYKKYGRCQLIDNREPDRQLAASHYISKYITKRITDYDFRIAKRHMR